jgi:putative ATP-binding cassette transporter
MISGGLYSLIIPTILTALNNNHDFILGEQYRGDIQSVFFILISLVLLAKATSVVMVNNLAKSAVAKLRIDLSKKINAMEVNQLENVGLPKLLNVLTEDMSRVTAASIAIPMVVVSTVTVIGMLVYLAILDLKIFSFTILAIIVGLFLFQFPVSKTKRYYNRARDLRDVMQEGFRGLIFGSYELKLNQSKSEQFLSKEIASPTLDSLHQEKKGDVILHIAGNSSEILCFFAIGMVVFLLPKGVGFESQKLYGVVMALLYITGPVASILGLIQQLKIGEISLKKINEIYTIDITASQSKLPIKPDWKTLTLSDIEYSYSVDDNSFALGKVNLSLNRGNTYFIVGGNGSGKSTLSKVISLHYPASDGKMSFDKQLVTSDNLISAREQFFVIYSDYYLFKRIYKSLDEADLALIDKYLKLFKLDTKTELVDNEFTTVKLSDGQRRRLALIVALVEDREVYILDEWAADQDPEFKDLYYNFILSDLKRKGKTVIAITHDDRYFSHCDEVVKMEDGGVIDMFRPAKNEIAYSA